MSFTTVAKKLRRKFLSLFCAAALFAFTIFFVAGCSVPGSAPASAARDTIVSTATSRQPVKICIVPDMSRSMRGTHTAQLRPEDLAPILELLKQIGGEVAVGVIAGNDLPLLRFRVDPRPIRPTPPPRTDDAPEWARRVNKYRAQLARYEQDDAQWQRVVAPRMDAFNRELSSLLSRERNEMRSRVLEAVSRADLFLNVDDRTWGQPTRRYLILISDGISDVGTPRRPRQIPPLRSGATVFIVNGTGGAGSLSHLNPQNVESVSDAVRDIVAREGGIRQ